MISHQEHPELIAAATEEAKSLIATFGGEAVSHICLKTSPITIKPHILVKVKFRK
jgi:hypothetical protein